MSNNKHNSETKGQAAPGNAIPKGGDTLAKFDNLLKAFVGATKTSMDSALTLSHMGITHFEAHGDLSYCQRFLEAMPTNYIRRQAFLEWLRAFSPVVVSGSTAQGYILTKDKSPEATPFNVEEALKTPFWDFAPEKATIDYNETNVFQAVRAAIAKFDKVDGKTGNARYHATTDKANLAKMQLLMMLRHVENAVKEGKRLTVTETNDNVTAQAGTAPAIIAA